MSPNNALHLGGPRVARLAGERGRWSSRKTSMKGSPLITHSPWKLYVGLGLVLGGGVLMFLPVAISSHSFGEQFAAAGGSSHCPWLARIVATADLPALPPTIIRVCDLIAECVGLAAMAVVRLRLPEMWLRP
jgi:hypothetical protein